MLLRIGKGGTEKMNYDLLTILVVISASVTFTLWRNTNRPKFKQLSKKFRKALWESDPIEPKHNEPKFKPLRRSREERDAKFFSEFEDFADVVNWYLASDTITYPWRLQELPDNDVGTAQTGPMFGRVYAVFYNQAQLGKLEIHAGVEKDIFTELKLHSVRLLNYHHLANFLHAVASHVVDRYPPSSEFATATDATSSVMLKALWDSYQISEFGNDKVDWGELRLWLHGTPTWYFDRRDCEGFAELKRAKIAAGVA
jgi:hypothetical protein